MPWVIGGSADLASSNEMPTKGELSFQPGEYANRNIWFGVREHGMGAALNGMSVHGGVRVYGGTFFTFSDYMRGSIRLAALSEYPVIYVFTHDSIGLGEDGPTHQPIEHLAAMRAIPNMVVIRPGDANESVVAWQVAIERAHGPTAMVFSRQKLPVFDQTKLASAQGVRKGAYTLLDADGGPPEVLLLATGSEVALALEAHAELAKQGTRARVVSFPSWELFEAQSQEYRDSVLPPSVTARLSIEAGVGHGLAPLGRRSRRHHEHRALWRIGTVQGDLPALWPDRRRCCGAGAEAAGARRGDQRRRAGARARQRGGGAFA